ncbi:MAG TPA: MnhB domain-containing protein [Xanthobacteraceae bacterium]|nr:MnhB domain-containing protein [Xanthobacteraceae bacterium]
MSTVFIFDVALVALLIAVATWIIAARGTFLAVVAFVAYGLLLAVVWVQLSAIDVALTEAAIGSGVTGMLLLGAASRLRKTEVAAVSAGAALTWTAAALCALIAAGLAAVVLFPPSTIFTLAPQAMAHLPESGLGNPVAGVLFVYRAFDTLLEKVVLVLALVGVWSLAPDRFWGGVPGLPAYEQPNSVLTLLAQLLPPLGIVVGIYMFWTGANNPGGAFQGGTILAAMWILVMIAGLQEVPSTNRRSLRFLVVVGPAIFLAIGLVGFVLADGFLAYPAGYAKPLIIVAEAALTLSIGVSLGLLAAGPPERIAQR